MKRVGHLFDKVVNFDNLMLAYTKARRGKLGKMEVRRFAADVHGNIRRMMRGLNDGTFSVGRYHYFQIRDPKERTICAASFEERVFHHALMQVCHPYFENHLTADTYATRVGKGGYAALEKALSGVTRYRYVVKLDFRKYFDSIDHAVLKRMLSRMFKDDALLRLFSQIIDSYHTAPGCGLPIGNLTSQYFANHYLSQLDRKVKNEWRVPFYVRYMDDMLLAADDKNILREAVARMVEYAQSELKLALKPAQYRLAAGGICWLGYRLMPHRLCLSSKAKRRYIRHCKEYAYHYARGEWTDSELRMHVQTLHAFISHACYKKFFSDCVKKGRIKGLTA